MVRPKKIDALKTMITNETDVSTIILLWAVALDEKDGSAVSDDEEVFSGRQVENYYRC
jgi:hypothetical protein